MGDMETTWGECQHYWLLAIKTVWKAKLHREQQEEQHTVSRNTMYKIGLVTNNL
jgi:hypothetical protein